MTLDRPTRKALYNVAIEAAQAAGRLIVEESQKSFQVFEKEGTSITSQVVTEVDYKSEQLILELLNPTMSQYDLGLLTEETTDDQSRLIKPYFWCIDPLDGTLPFTETQTGYAVSIALVNQAGKTEIGVVYDPVTETIYSSLLGEDVYRNGEPWRDIVSLKEDEDTLILFMDRSFRSNSLFQQHDLLQKLAEDAGYKSIEVITESGGVMNAIAVLRHAHAVYFKFPKTEKGGGSTWDYAATAGLFTEADRPNSDLFGQPLNLNNQATTYMNENGILYASNANIASAVKQLHSYSLEKPLHG